MDIGEWLKGLGLQQYQDSFAKNEIDEQSLSELNSEDLKEIGVKAIGHRKKLLAAISKLGQQKSTPAVAERRQLTVMFCDLVGSTSLANRLDPEDLRNIIVVYQESCKKEVHKMNGFVAKYMGDGILVYFGYPSAIEDAPERAIRAALNIVKSISDLPKDLGLQVRIGISTGLVIVGDLVGEGSAQEASVIGDTPNLAARLQSLAKPGQILVSSHLQRLTRNLFNFRDLGTVELKGFDRPIPAWLVENSQYLEARLDPNTKTTYSPFVGRENEMSQLLALQAKAWVGDGQMVLITGEPGIGKSRLTNQLLEKMGGAKVQRIRLKCSSIYSDSTLYPIITMLERECSIERNDLSEVKLEKLEKYLFSGDTRLEKTVPLFAKLFSLPLSNKYEALAGNPAEQRRKILEVIVNHLKALSKKEPLFLVFEDLHWADASSLEMINLFIEELRDSQILFLATARPGFQPGWIKHPKLTIIVLQRLDQNNIRTMVNEIYGETNLPPKEFVDQIIDRTDGIPLFIEEISRMASEGTLLGNDPKSVFASGIKEHYSVPATLQNLLMVRLDSLQEAKEIAQVAAVIGREFSYRLLSAIIDLDDAVLTLGLKKLISHQIIFQIGKTSDFQFMFKHALTQDTAYESLLKARRQILHQKIADVINKLFPKMAEAEPELVAYHYTQAGKFDEAFEYYAKAGERDLLRSAYIEAVANLRKAQQITGLDESPEKKIKRSNLKIALGNALISLHGHGAIQTTEAFLDALEFATTLSNGPAMMAANYGLWAGSYVRGEGSRLVQIAKELRKFIEGVPESIERCPIQRVSATSAWFTGDFPAAKLFIEQALNDYNPEKHASLAFRFGQDVGVATMVSLAIINGPMGHRTKAYSIVNDAVRLAERTQQISSIAYVHTHVVMFSMCVHDMRLFKVHIDKLLQLTKIHKLGMWETVEKMWRVWFELENDGGDDAYEKLNNFVHAKGDKKITIMAPVIKLSLATAEARKSLEQGLASLEALLRETSESNQVWFDAEIYRKKAQALLLNNKETNWNAAEEALIKSLHISRRQQTRLFELRGSSDLAVLWLEQKRYQEAQALLEPICNWFSHDHTTPEVAFAQSILQSIKQKAV